MVTTVSAIYRHPVKGLSAEKMDRVALMPGECLPHDRRFAIALGTPKSGSHVTHRWRRESGANPSLKWGFRRLGTTVIPRPLWTITEAEKGYFGLENGGVSVFAPWQLPPYLDPKLLITLSFSPSGVLAAGEFTVYKRDRTTALSAHPAKT